MSTQHEEHDGNKVIAKIAPYWKAVAGLLTPPLTALGVALTPDSAGGAAVTATEWVGIVLAGLATGAVVFAVPNRDPAGAHQAESVQPPPRPRDENGRFI